VSGGESQGRLEPWNEQIVDLGMEIVSRRRQGVVALGAEAERLYPALGGRGSITLEYRSALGDVPTAASFHERLRARLPEEIRRGQTLVGPHRDDLLVALDGRDLRTFGSRGQQRLMALTLRLAEAAHFEADVAEPVQAVALREERVAGERGGAFLLAKLDVEAWVARWMREPLPDLEDKTPAQMLRNPEGQRAVEQVLERMRGGLPA
jgi:hypothetical protein